MKRESVRQGLKERQKVLHDLQAQAFINYYLTDRLCLDEGFFWWQKGNEKAIRVIKIRNAN